MIIGNEQKFIVRQGPELLPIRIAFSSSGGTCPRVRRMIVETTLEQNMASTLKTLVAAAILGSAGSMASAAPVNMTPISEGLSNNFVQVHGDHRSCQRDRRGWHRHNRFGERRVCREWRGRGKRPDTCVRVGPIWYCDY